MSSEILSSTPPTQISFYSCKVATRRRAHRPGGLGPRPYRQSVLHRLFLQPGHAPGPVTLAGQSSLAARHPSVGDPTVPASATNVRFGNIISQPAFTGHSFEDPAITTASTAAAVTIGSGATDYFPVIAANGTLQLKIGATNYTARATPMAMASPIACSCESPAPISTA